MSQEATTTATTTTATTTAPEVNQPTDRAAENTSLPPQQENNALIAETATTTHPPPAYNETTPPQPQPVPEAAPPSKIQPGLEKRAPITLGELGALPSCVLCPRCDWRVITRVEKHSGDHAQKMGIIACLCLGILFAWVPCVIDDCKDSHHYCTNCGYILAVWDKGAASARVVMTPEKIKALKSNPAALPYKADPTAPTPEKKKAGQW